MGTWKLRSVQIHNAGIHLITLKRGLISIIFWQNIFQCCQKIFSVRSPFEHVQFDLGIGGSWGYVFGERALGLRYDMLVNDLKGAGFDRPR